MASSNTAGYVIIGFLVLAIIASIIWLFWARNQLAHCQGSEHPACPVYYCAKTNKACVPVPSAFGDAGSAFRLNEKGEVQCQPYSVPTSVTNVNPSQRAAWPNI